MAHRYDRALQPTESSPEGVDVTAYAKLSPVEVRAWRGCGAALVRCIPMGYVKAPNEFYPCARLHRNIEVNMELHRNHVTKENHMPLVYPDDLRSLDKHALFGSGECVDIIKALVPGLIGIRTQLWKAGAMVKDSPNLRRGTAIATFTNGRFPRANTGQHAAIFVAHAGSGIWIVDQYRSSLRVQFRHMEVPRDHAQRPDGTWPQPSRNPLAFSVIER